MAINYDHIMSLKSGPQSFSYGDRETMLYALGVGFCQSDALDANELRYVYENDLRTVPTMATVIAWNIGLLKNTGINYLMVVHGEQRLTLYRPLPSAADIVASGRVTGCFDKGVGKGAIILTEIDVELASGEPLCKLGSTTFARGDGGFGGPQGSGPPPHEMPSRPPDLTCELPTRHDQALIYRLSGDRNPLHVDPNVSTAAGFPRPILHGLATYGIACRAVLKEICAYDHTRVRRFDVRFSAPIFPGETVVTDLWQDGSVISFRARARERDVTVLANGLCEINSA